MIFVWWYTKMFHIFSHSRWIMPFNRPMIEFWQRLFSCWQHSDESTIYRLSVECLCPSSAATQTSRYIIYCYLLKSNLTCLSSYSTALRHHSSPWGVRSWTGQHILESTTPLWNITASKAMCVNMGLLMCFWVTGKQAEHCDICPRNK